MLNRVRATVRAIINTAAARAAPKPKRPREVQFVTYEAGNIMLRENVGWRLAPEEDTNKTTGWVWLERDA